MYHFDSQQVARIISHAYTDTGMVNEFFVQQYLKLLEQGELRQIMPSLLPDFTTDGSGKPLRSYEQITETTGQKPQLSNNDEATSDAALSIKNERDKEEFDRQAYKFLFVLHHTIFEDGMDNEAINLFRNMMAHNKFVCIAWLQEFWAEHQNDSVVTEGVIRLISTIDDKAYWKPLMSIVRCGLTDKCKPVQEAAIMVIESWRTLACYYALKQTQFADGWIKDYATEVMLELEDELHDEIHKED